MEPVGPSGEILSDYSLRHAHAAGAEQAVFVVAREAEVSSRTHHEAHPPSLPTSYSYQRMERIPADPTIPEGRRKPWGTAHALLSAKAKIRGPCVVVNADDYYGATAFDAATEFLQIPSPDLQRLALVGYRLSETLSPHGAVSRAVVSQRPNGTVDRLVEVTDLSAADRGITGLREGVTDVFTGREVVSMNCWVLDAAILPLLENAFERFLGRAEDHSTAEFGLPEALMEVADRAGIPVHVLAGGEKWMGLTHARDREDVRVALLPAWESPCS